MLSIIKSTNECSGDESCEFYVNIVNNIKKKIKPTKLPDLSGSRLIEWYVYKKLFSDEYDTNVSKLFLENCLKL